MIDFVKDTQYPCLGYGTMCVVLRQLQVWRLGVAAEAVVQGCLLDANNMLLEAVRGCCRR